MTLSEKFEFEARRILEDYQKGRVKAEELVESLITIRNTVDKMRMNEKPDGVPF